MVIIDYLMLLLICVESYGLLCDLECLVDEFYDVLLFDLCCVE